jgi:hypothetical protein
MEPPASIRPLNQQDDLLKDGAAMDTPPRLLKIRMTEDMVEALTQVNFPTASERHRQVFREALRALVNLAKAEKMLEMKMDSASALGIRNKGS